MDLIERVIVFVFKLN